MPREPVNTVEDGRLRVVELKQRKTVLQRICAEAYQLANVVGAPARVLDNLAAAEAGEPMPHPTFLPVSARDCGSSRNLEPGHSPVFRREGADGFRLKQVSNDYQISSAMCEAVRRQVGLGRGFPAFWGLVLMYGVLGSARWLLAKAWRRWNRGRGVHGGMRDVEQRVDDLEQVCAEAYILAGAVDAPERVLDNLWAAAAGEPIPHATFLPVLPADCGGDGSDGRRRLCGAGTVAKDVGR